MVKLSTTICWLAFAPVLGRELKGELVEDPPRPEYESLYALMTRENNDETPVVAVAIQCRPLPESDFLVYLLTKKWSVNQHNNLMDKSGKDLKDALFPPGEYKWADWADWTEHDKKWADWTEHDKISIAASSDDEAREILGLGKAATGVTLVVDGGKPHNFQDTVQTLNFTAFDNLGSKKLNVSAYTLKLGECPLAIGYSALVVELAPIIQGELQEAVVTTAESIPQSGEALGPVNTAEGSSLFSADESWGPVEYILISVFVGVPLCCCLLFVVCKAISKKKDQDRSRKEEQEAEQNSSPRLQRPRVSRPHAGNRQ